MVDVEVSFESKRGVDSSGGAGCWMKLGEAAHVLGVSEITLRRKVKGGKIPHEFRDGRYFIFMTRDPASGAFVDPMKLNYATTQWGQGGNGQRIFPTPVGEGTPPQLEAVMAEQRAEWEAVVESLREDLEERENMIRDLRRTLEDQATLISFLEISLQEQQTLHAVSSASFPK